MDVFRVRDWSIDDDREFTGGLVDIHDQRIRDHVAERMAKGYKWPDPWLSLYLALPPAGSSEDRSYSPIDFSVRLLMRRLCDSPLAVSHDEHVRWRASWTRFDLNYSIWRAWTVGSCASKAAPKEALGAGS
jgi:hypothetical protein